MFKNARVLINPKETYPKTSGVTKAKVLLNPDFNQETFQPNKKTELAMNITRTETQIGTTKHGHPVINLSRED